MLWHLNLSMYWSSSDKNLHPDSLMIQCAQSISRAVSLNGKQAHQVNLVV